MTSITELGGRPECGTLGDSGITVNKDLFNSLGLLL